MHSPIQHSSTINRSLTIGVDVRCLSRASSRRRGIGRYVMNLLSELTELAPQHRFVFFGDDYPWSVNGFEELLNRHNVKYDSFSAHFSSSLDVYLITDPLPVVQGEQLFPKDPGSTPCAAIIYDLIPLAFPEQYLASNAQMFDEYHSKLEEIQTRISLCLPISDFVGKDLQQSLGISKGKVKPIYGGLDKVFDVPVSQEEIQAVKSAKDITGNYFFYAGGFDPRKNITALLEAYCLVTSKLQQPHSLVLAGECDSAWLEEIKIITGGTAALANVKAIGYVSDDELRALYSGATAFVFPSFHEGFGLPAVEAMACGCPVIAANETSLKEIVADAGILVNPNFAEDIADAMMCIATDISLANHYRELGRLRGRTYRWSDVASRTLHALESIALSGRKMIAPIRKLRVTVVNRANALTARGGDTVIMENLYRSLRDLNADVDISTPESVSENTDIIHLVNLTIHDVAQKSVRAAERTRKPLVITTLFEDWPRYLERSFGAMAIFREHLSGRLDEYGFREALKVIRNRPDGPQVGNDEAAHYAARLLACGESEALRLRDSYNISDDKVSVVKFPVSDFSNSATERARNYIRSRFGFDEFVVCCGRLESRKNQLMLLKALQDDDIPIVLASGGFTPQPEYADMVQKFKRKAPVRVLGRIPNDGLAILLNGASVHALPSWYELPGLVTLEAATCGTPVVASEWGAIGDYLPKDSYIACEPDDPESIRSAVLKALKTSRNGPSTTVARSYTLEAFGKNMLSEYEAVLSQKHSAVQTAAIHPSIQKQINIPIAQEREMTTATKTRFDVSIIIPVHNQSRLTLECLDAISLDNCSATYEVIIVDNHSTDDTPRILESVEGDIKVLREPANRGFAEACNRGARIAEGKYLIFLNNDTAPKAGWLDQLVKTAETNQNVGAVGARLLYPDGKVQHAGVAVNLRGVPYHIFQNFDGEHAAVTETRDMLAVTAACMLVPANVFSKFGGFDSSYTNGFEDVDFCLRLAQSGLRIIYCGDSVLTHHEGSTEGRRDHEVENMQLFFDRWSKNLSIDEDKYLSKFGYRLEWGEKGGTYRQMDTNSATPPAIADTSTLVDRARKLYAEGDFAAAAQTLQALVESKMTLAGDDGFELWQTLGNSLARLNRAEEAETAFLRAVELNSNSERPFLGLGSVAMLQQNWMAAQYSFMAALAKNPSTLRGEFGVGVSLAARGQHEEALTHFERVVAAEPNNAEALYYLYRSSMEISKPEKAIESLAEYVMSHPSDTDFMFHLVGALWKSGELSRAVEVCSQILEVNPEHTQARDVLRHMEESLVEHA